MKPAKEPKFLCIVCDGERTLEMYESEETELEVVAIELVSLKMCARHARKVEEVRAAREKAEAEEKLEIERTVA